MCEFLEEHTASCAGDRLLGRAFGLASMQAIPCEERVKDLMWALSVFSPYLAAETISETIGGDGGSLQGMPPRPTLYAPPTTMADPLCAKMSLDNGMKAHYTFRQVFAIFSPNKDFAAGVRKISEEKERLTLVGQASSFSPVVNPFEMSPALSCERQDMAPQP